MRWGLAVLLFTTLLVGCSPRAPKAEVAPLSAATPVPDERAIAASLVMEPEILASSPAIDLSRDLRVHGAYAGYEETIVTDYYLYQDDRQVGYGAGWGTGGGWRNNDRFERSAVIQRVGRSYR